MKGGRMKKIKPMDFNPEQKQRVTLFLDPIIVRKTKAEAALEALTLSEVVERVLKEYVERLD